MQIFLPLILSAASLTCGYGTTAAYLEPQHTVNLARVCWYVSFDVNGQYAPEHAENVPIIRLQPDPDGLYLHQWYGDRSHVYPAFESAEFAAIIQARPGNMWIVGNEMDLPGQGQPHAGGVRGRLSRWIHGD